jgi:hypothetical protein
MLKAEVVEGVLMVLSLLVLETEVLIVFLDSNGRCMDLGVRFATVVRSS